MFQKYQIIFEVKDSLGERKNPKKLRQMQNLKSEKKSLDDYLILLQSRLDEISKSIGKEFEGHHRKNKQELSEDINNATAAAAETIENRILAAQDSVKTQAFLEAPINYWKKKQRAHTHMVWAMVIGIGATAGVAYLAFYELLDFAATNPEFISFRNGGTSVNLINSVLVGLPAFGIIWVFRILVRLLMSNIHLRDDAQERMTMIDTYLALRQHIISTSGEETLTEKLKDLDQMIQVIFRPAATGLTNDDAVAPQVYDLVNRVASQK